MKIRKSLIFLSAIILLLIICSLPEMFHINLGVSEAIGSVRNGKLKNGYLIPFKGNNYSYFSSVSYYLFNNGYVHSSVYATILDAYHTCETTCPGIKFRIMECTSKHGGRMLLHWTHQNGTSADFMVPLKRGNKTEVWINKTGLFHYLLKFNEDGRFSLAHKTVIDFETMAKHLLALDDAAESHGLRIRKVLFNTFLHDELFATPSGKLLYERNLNFIPHLSDMINNLHDDHYHIDFEFVGEEK
jgi:penicillin-insensitive murein endopeptidase